ncbi:MAG: hypothetical protein KDN22_08565 [Verrucomicrobiae bacterium]|nr:hypothetical protein [Verrucomicrobiae bacterium]
MMNSTRFRRIVASIFALGLTSPLLFANGGGYHTGLKFTGSVAPFEPEGVEKIRIVREDLDIVLKPDHASVAVTYLMRNEDDGKVTARFGFPVEDTQKSKFETGFLPEGAPKRLSDNGQTTGSEYCTNYEVMFGAEAVKASYVVEPVAQGLVKPFDGIERFEGINGWMVSEVKFRGSEEKQVRITYDSPYDAEGTFISSNSKHSERAFRYRLSTGGVWKGTIQSGTVRVIPKGIDLAELRIQTPANRFKRIEDGSWIWHFKDLEPTLADDIDIKTTLPVSRYRDYEEGAGSVAYLKRGDNWSYQHRSYMVHSTSYLKEEGGMEYPARNVKNDDYSSDENEGFAAWVEGRSGDGIGEGLDFELKQAAPVAKIAIRPGYGKTEDLFKANNRPKIVTITLDDEYTFDAELQDIDEQQLIPLPGYVKPVKKVSLRIKEVYHGSRYQDTAIADVIFETRLAIKPKIRGSR